VASSARGHGAAVFGGVVVLAALAMGQGGSRSAASPAKADDAAAGHARMVATLADVARRAPDENVWIGDQQARAFRSLAADPAFLATPRRRWSVFRTLGFHELRLGNDEAAIAAYQRAWDEVPSLGTSVHADDQTRTLFDLAVAHLRLGESQNCVARHTSESCIVPIGPAGVHTNQDGSRRGIALLDELLARDPGHLPARWLRNVAAMTIGAWPDGVPAAVRIGPETFASAQPFPRFPDEAPALGLAVRDVTGSVAIDDFDGDGVLDVVTSTADPRVPVRYFRGVPGARFVERTDDANLAGITGGLGLVHADVDGDGDADLLVLRGAWQGRFGRQPMSLLRNDGHGRFTDVTYASGLADRPCPTQTAAFADYDGDGDLDLYVGTEWAASVPCASQLFRNDGGLRFTDVASAARVENQRVARGVAWGDFDDDGRPDLFVSNWNADNRLYRNRGDGTFEDVAGAAGVRAPWSSGAVVTLDVDQDGRLDLFVAAATPFHAASPGDDRYDELGPMRAAVASTLGLPHDGETGRLYRNRGDGRFDDVTAAFGIARVLHAGGVGVGDLDADGFEDLYVGTAYAGYEGILPNVLWRNTGGKGFADVTTAAGMGHLQKAGGIAMADVDADGDLDVVLRAGGLFAGDAFVDVVFANPGGAGRALPIRLRARGANTAAIGARLRAEVGGRVLHRRIGTGGSFGGGPLLAWFGLGDAPRIDRLEVTWPDGTRQTWRDLPAGAPVTLVQGE
jgi:hypothetical protein